jgi:DNA-directed RNA polymerase subunit RPC12/RpoP
VAVQCVKEGTFFLDPKSLNARHQGDRCPRCRERILAEFEAATDEQLHRAGLRAGDYT